MGQSKPLSGKKILIVEDSFLVAEEIQRIVRDAGAAKAVPTVRSALAAPADEHFDGAMLDGQLHNGTSSEVARELSSKGIPFIVVTGHSRDWLPEELRDVPYVPKPFDREELIAVAARHFTRD